MTEQTREDDGREPEAPTPGAKFAQVGHNVVMATQTVATARSKTMARRIANALNVYKTNSDGR